MKVFIKYNDIIYKLSDSIWEDSSLTLPISEQDYTDHGTDIESITTEQWEFFSGEFEILAFDETGGELEMSVPEFQPIYNLHDEKVTIATWSDSEDTPDIIKKVELTNNITYMVSLDGSVYYGFNGGWTQGYGMSLSELTSINESNWKDLDKRIYQNNLFIRAYINNQSPDGGAILKTITVQYVPNQPPVVTDSSLSPDEVRLDSSYLTLDYEDREGDTVEYRILIQRAGEGFEQIHPEEGYISTGSSGSISHSFNYNVLNPGLNIIRVEIKDQRGSVKTKDFNLTVINEDPEIVYTYTTWNVSGTISDPDGDDVDIKLLINGEVHRDYSGYTPSPRSFFFEWDSPDLNLNEMNTITIVAKDRRGGEVVEAFTVEGTYRGIMFKDQEGHYYTTDKGELLKMLDLGNLVAGQETEPVKIYIESTLGYTIEDIEVTSLDGGMPDVATVMFSQNEPFIPQEQITLVGPMEHADEREFFVSIYTIPGRGKMDAQFIIHAEPKQE